MYKHTTTTHLGKEHLKLMTAKNGKTMKPKISMAPAKIK